MKRDANGRVVRAMTVAGSDSGGGAGIQADLKTFAAFEVYGTACITAVTAQNTVGVQSVQELSPSLVREQCNSVFADIGADAVKTGMLGSAQIVHTVIEVLQAWRPAYLVVDPVMVAKGGESLLHEDALLAVKYKLCPLATVLTPNLPEAEVLCGYAIRTRADVLRAARDLADFGARIVVIKGGHADGQEMSEDVVWCDGEVTYLRAARVHSRKTHGTGCTFSAAITAGLAAGLEPLDAIATAKAFVTEAIAAAVSWDVGQGHGPTDHSVPVRWGQRICPGYTYQLRDGLFLSE